MDFFSRLRDIFSLSSKVLEWFQSYLEQYYQRVVFRGILYNVLFLLSGVPQGSVLGPLVFTIYIRPLGIIEQRYGVKYRLYSDDTQLYISLDPDNGLNTCYPWRILIIILLYCLYSAFDDSKVLTDEMIIKQMLSNWLHLITINPWKPSTFQMGASSINPNGSVKQSRGYLW